MSEQRLCANCGKPIQLTTYALGQEWDHYDPNAGYATRQRGTAWHFCKIQVATPDAALATHPPQPDAREADGGEGR